MISSTTGPFVVNESESLTFSYWLHSLNKPNELRANEWVNEWMDYSVTPISITMKFKTHYEQSGCLFVSVTSVLGSSSTIYITLPKKKPWMNEWVSIALTLFIWRSKLIVTNLPVFSSLLISVLVIDLYCSTKIFSVSRWKCYIHFKLPQPFHFQAHQRN